MFTSSSLETQTETDEEYLAKRKKRFPTGAPRIVKLEKVYKIL